MALLTNVLRAFRATPSLLVVGLLCASGSAGSENQFDEYDVKAAFLLNFTKFVQWPAGKSTQVIVLCIVGDDPFGSTLDQLSMTATARPRLELRRLDDPLEARSCHIAFVRTAERAKVTKLLESIGTAPVLTVGEDADFAERGGVICLPVENDRVKILVNTVAADRADLKLSAKLLSLARLVPEKKKD